MYGSLGRRVCHRPHGGAGDTQQNEIEQKEMNLCGYVNISSCQIRDVETKIDKNLNTARCRVEFNIEKEEMNQSTSTLPVAASRTNPMTSGR